ncbi:MAG: DUF5123 domain-containing protein [Prevotella sp.]|nr:DUF5123 domain-containing protein [Prevotella sp.]
MKKFFFLIVGALMTLCAQAEDKLWNFSTWEKGDITSTTEIDGLTVTATNEKKVSIDGSDKGLFLPFKQRLKLGGSGNEQARSLQFEVSERSLIIIAFTHSSSSGDPRPLILAKDNFKNVVMESTVAAGTFKYLTYYHTGGKAKFYTYSGNSGLNIYGILVKSLDGDVVDVYDFAAEADAGNDPTKMNTANTFYVWTKNETGYYCKQPGNWRGYEWTEGSLLPKYDFVFTQNTQISGKLVKNNPVSGWKADNETRPIVVAGLTAGMKVTFNYDASSIKDESKQQLIWAQATGDGSDLYVTEASVNGATAVSGETKIPSGTPISVTSTNCGYLAVMPFKNMVIQSVIVEMESTGEAYMTTTDFSTLKGADLPDDLKEGIEEFTITDGRTKAQLTISSSGDVEAPNKYDVDADDNVQLELNGGTLTFQAAEATSLKKITFYYNEWNEANAATTETLAYVAKRAEGEDDGEETPETGIVVDADKKTAVWDGSADKVIVSIGGKTLIKKIVIEIGEKVGEKIELDLPTGKDLGAEVAAVYAQNPYVGSITLNLEKDGKYTTSKPMYISKPLIINGAEGAVIDASKNDAPFIQMMVLPELGLNEAGAYRIDEVTIKGVEIKGLKNRLFYADRQKYLIGKLTLDNSIVGIDGTVSRTIFDFYCGGNTEELIIKNSTLWANPANTHRGGLFSSQAGDDVPSLGGPVSQKFSIQNSTFYNIAKGVTPILHRDHSRYWLSFELKNNVIVNSGEPSKFVLGLNEGQPGEECTWDIDSNSFAFDGQYTANEEAYAKNNSSGLAHLANPDKGDFSLSVADDALTRGIGDPRWLTGHADELLVDVPTGKDIGAEVAAAKGDKKPVSTLIRLAKDGKYTMGSTIETSGDIVITGVEGALPTIDASALEAPFLTLAGTETAAKNADGTDNANYKYINRIVMEYLKIDNLKQPLVRDTQKTHVGTLLFYYSLLNMEGSSNIFDFNGQGYPGLLAVFSSTLWSKEGHTGYFLQSSGRVKDLDSDQSKLFQTISIGSSTLYKISAGKQLNNLQGKGQKSLMFMLTNNIIAESTQAGNEVRGWLGGQNSTNPTTVYYGNSYWADGAVQAGWTDSSKQGYDDSESSIEGDPQFKNPAEGDFTLGAGTAQNERKIGDPRWLVEYVPTAIEAVETAKGTVNDGAWYTLQGVRVDKPAKGLYIHNGKKVVVK